jgi:small-conductance mechanosensitive channel
MDAVLESLQTLLTQFLLLLPKLVVSVIVFVVTLIASAFLSKTVEQALAEREARPEITLLLRKVTRWTILILGTIIALQQVEFNVTAFLTSLGLLGFTLGFAIQDVSKNFVAGILLLLQQPFNIGDAIEVAGHRGNVETIDLRSTELATASGKHITIPNADVFASSIVNYGHRHQRLLELQAGVAYESDLEDVRATAEAAIAQIPGVLADPAPQVAFEELAPSTVNLTVYYWVDRGQTSVAAARDAGVCALKRAFEEAEIDMPYPTQVVHVRHDA